MWYLGAHSESFMPQPADMPPEMPADAMPPGGPPMEGPPMEGPPPGGASDNPVAEVQAPPPPAEGYSEKCVKDLLKALGLALKAATKAMGREAPSVPEAPAEVFEKGKMRQPFPGVIVQEIAMLLMMASQIGGKHEGRYDGDLMELLASDDGLDRLATLLELLSKDKVLLSALKEAQKAAPAKGPVAETEEVEVAAGPEGEEVEAMDAREYA